MNIDAPSFVPASLLPQPTALERFATLSGADVSLLQNFSVESSLPHPFVVFSDGDFVEGLAPPSAAGAALMWQALARWTHHASESNAALLVDFEGEIPGYGSAGYLRSRLKKKTDVAD